MEVKKYNALTVLLTSAQLIDIQSKRKLLFHCEIHVSLKVK